jgi:hypothetical protein
MQDDGHTWLLHRIDPRPENIGGDVRVLKGTESRQF